jgi:hypothetical protein
MQVRDGWATTLFFQSATHALVWADLEAAIARGSCTGWAEGGAAVTGTLSATPRDGPVKHGLDLLPM